ncbi:hypothetical protein C8R47DRAFT_1066629 [Mycena vitilis]|nr:hypothetical protein C8R47DRAFT_1066629 [Mycena vitilis]
MALFRPALSRRDAILILLGAAFMHLFTVFFPHDAPPPALLIDAVREHFPPDPPPPAPEVTRYVTRTTTEITTLVQATTVASTVAAQPSAGPASASPLDLALELPPTTLVAHAPGWTLFKNLYMSNDTFFIVTDTPTEFPEMRMMASTPLKAENTPENIAAREPTEWTIRTISRAEGQKMWGGDVRNGKANRVLSVPGSTVLVNEPTQFLRHYYHLVAELLFGVQAFWHGAHSPPSVDPAREYAYAAQGTFASPSSPSTSPSASNDGGEVPPIDRLIFARADADGWRDNPGFNAYFLRAALPGVSVEVQEDWADRVRLTSEDAHSHTSGGGHTPSPGPRAWHFPTLLLTDRSAAHRGPLCGSQTQRIAAEALGEMRRRRQVVGGRVGGWWEPLRGAVGRFAGAEGVDVDVAVDADADGEYGAGSGSGGEVKADADTDGELKSGGDPHLPFPARIVITYISRQSAGNRKLAPESHVGLVSALEALVARKNAGNTTGAEGKKGREWELVVVEAEKLSKDEQIRIAARTTILLGVHGNGLTHLVMMPPTRVSTVIEMFYPGGFAHDYQWTSRALGGRKAMYLVLRFDFDPEPSSWSFLFPALLHHRISESFRLLPGTLVICRMKHFAVWNDTYRTEGVGEGKPSVDYPDGFQGNSIPAHGPAVAQLIEDRVALKV